MRFFYKKARGKGRAVKAFDYMVSRSNVHKVPVDVEYRPRLRVLRDTETNEPNGYMRFPGRSERLFPNYGAQLG